MWKFLLLFLAPEAVEFIFLLSKKGSGEVKSMNLFNDEGMLIKCKWEGGFWLVNMWMIY